MVTGIDSFTLSFLVIREKERKVKDSLTYR